MADGLQGLRPVAGLAGQIESVDAGSAEAAAGDTYNITIQAVDSQSFAKMLEKGKGTLENLIVNGIQRGGSLRSAIKGATS